MLVDQIPSGIILEVLVMVDEPDIGRDQPIEIQSAIPGSYCVKLL